MGSAMEYQKLMMEIVYINMPGPEEPTSVMTGGELLHGFLVDLYQSANPEVRNYISFLCNKWNIHYRGEPRLRYLVIVEKADGNYSAYSPDIPGCIATGTTRDEAEKNIREAISFHIEGLKEDDLPVPEPSSFTEYIEV